MEECNEERGLPRFSDLGSDFFRNRTARRAPLRETLISSGEDYFPEPRPKKEAKSKKKVSCFIPKRKKEQLLYLILSPQLSISVSLKINFINKVPSLYN